MFDLVSNSKKIYPATKIMFFHQFRVFNEIAEAVSSVLMRPQNLFFLMQQNELSSERYVQ
jgi:hypothetical protein